MDDCPNIGKLVGTRENERVLSVIHRHWFDIGAHLAGAALLAFTLVIGTLVLPFVFPTFGDSQHAALVYFIETLFLLLLWLYAFLVWIDVWFDVWIITSERVINIEQKGLFARETSELALSKVQDVTSDVEGIVKSVLNYGDVFVQTAAEEERFHFRNVPDPVAIKDLVMKLSQGAHRDDLDEAVGLLKEHEREK